MIAFETAWNADRIPDIRFVIPLELAKPVSKLTRTGRNLKP